MNPTILITGGCRSGKSSHALTLASQINGRRKLFVATCVAGDEEMRARVLRHQRERGDDWQTIEEPADLVEVIQRRGPGADLMLVDCLTLWVSNLLVNNPEEAAFLNTLDRLGRSIGQPPCPLIFVTNEVGAGIVPENALARRFRDFTGWVNQRVAAACDTVIWMVAGIPVTIKPRMDAASGRQD
ncbi:MAG: bifunctional adenosylcobinamide kinase/adenosylcobinamide-phosphate guanylyltransferase [Desulfosarcinaceae bacterium]